MRFLRKILDRHGRLYEKGGKLEKLYPIYEAFDNFLFTSGKVTCCPPHIRDVNDFKRIMMMVVYALIPTVIMALYNTGYQANLIFSQLGKVTASGWRIDLLTALGIGFDPANIFANIFHGALYFFPVYAVTMAVGGFWEVVFAVVRKHEIQEGFMVTGLLFPLILPPAIPLWQVAIGISFGIVIGKEVFGGVGMNILNPVLTARAFLFFAYPLKISGDAVWVAVDGLSMATPLAVISERGVSALGKIPGIVQGVELEPVAVTFKDAFLGLIPGSMGETSTLACLIGAFILIVTGIASWRIMVSVLAGMVGLSILFNLIGSGTNPMFSLSPLWHLVLGGFAFGTVFMATDPVSAAVTNKGKYLYGLLIGILVVLIRVLNPAFPEGMMLAILFANVFASIIDRFFINSNIKRRLLRNEQ
ncbi:MAG: NADH:ubiquinone reductase (Na(+)-transporting) subunit B [Candidatus Aminicenantes bacterium]|nr:NADH:ubiquinone reductase (Na(+)-transporting) subunit B [Candidatus Aminicenantes bacterium]